MVVSSPRYSVTYRVAASAAPAVILLLLSVAAAHSAPLVHKGVADLRNWDVQADPVRALNGTWLMRWGSATAEPVPFKVPGVWNGREIKDHRLPGFGHAWFTVILLLPEKHPPLAVSFPYLKSAAEFYVNGRLVAHRGRPGDTAAEEVPQTRPALIRLPANDERIRLVVEISNHFHYEGGINSRVVIGSEATLGHGIAIQRAISIGVFSVSAALALYLLLLIRGRSRVGGEGLFIVVLTLSVLRVLTTGNWLARFGVSAEVIYRLEYLTIFLFPPLYVWMVRTLFPHEVASRICQWFTVIGALGVCAVLFLPVAWFTRLRDPGSIIIVVSALFVLACSIRAIKNKRPGAWFVTAGVVCLGAAVTHDSMRYAHMINGPDLASIGLLCFIFMHGLVLGNRILSAWDENAALSRRLAVLNRDLETKIEHRTRKLARQSTQLERAKDFAEKDARNKSYFLSTLSHELRTPLSGIDGNLELLQRELPAGAAGARISRIRDASSALVQMLDGVLEAGRAEAGRAVLREMTFAPRALLDEVRTLLEPKALDKGLSLDVDVDHAVPSHVYGGAVLLRRVMINLITNAIKFTDAGRVTIVMTTDEENGNYRITVVDTGRGMTRDVQEQAFYEFYRETELQASGAGMGLFIVNRLVNVLHGSIVVDSQPGAGTRVEMVLPLETDREPTSRVVQTSRPYYLLLVEDVPLNREVIGALLTADGHHVVVVGDGGEAVAAVRDDRYDAILMDLRLRQMHGDEATRHIRALPDQQRAATPVIALTAEASNLDGGFFSTAGIDAILTKPVNRDELYPLLERVCTGQSRRELDLTDAVAVGAIDESRLRELADALGDERLRTLLFELVTTLTNQCEVLETAQVDSDQAAIDAAVHRLIGAAENFGFSGIGRCADRVRQASEQARTAAIEELIRVIRDTVPLVRRKARELSIAP